ncbi:hypothetical protein OBBRIDRAFT_697657, partial [Obba rivulosa]
EFERDKSLWFQDGNIILVAENVGFRLYRGVLAARSAVFRDLFQIPQPMDGETYENCAVIRLHDKAGELRHFLNALTGFTYPDPTRVNFEEVAALAGLSHKYGIEDLCDASLARLKTMFPTQLSIWHDMGVDMSVSNAIQAVNLACLTGTTSILPVALYLCCQL